MKSVMVFGGTGRVGNYVILYLVQNPSIDKLWIVCRDFSKALTIINNSIISAAINESYPRIEVIQLDLFNVSSVIKILKEKKPRIILNSTAMFSLFPFFPQIKAKQRNLGNLVSGSAHNLSQRICLLYPLMESVKESGIDTKVVNLSSSDNAHTVLSKVGLCPTVGAGTIDLTVQGVRQSVAKNMNIFMRDINVKMVAHHAIRGIFSDKIPYYIKIYNNGQDITKELKLREIISEAVDISGVETLTTLNTTNAPMTAASAVRNVLALFSDKKVSCHASGVKGIPGGFPVSLSSLGVEICPPDGLSQEEIVRINTEGMKIEGIEEIENDGTVIFTIQEQRWIKEGLGLTWDKMPLSKTREMAQELYLAYLNL